MKKKIATLAALLLTAAAGAQNLQLHYDAGSLLYPHKQKERPVLTSTVEMLRPDRWGSTFFFVDMDYADEGVQSAYWEVSREIRIGSSPLLVHVEYDGGLNYIKNAYLAGLTREWHSRDFARLFTLTAMYKYIQKLGQPHNYQLTGVWSIQFAHNGLFTFSGFADWWREKSPAGNFVFLSEPQLWVNLYRLRSLPDDLKLSVGSELELSSGFAGRKGFYAIPTLALKWSFD